MGNRGVEFVLLAAIIVLVFLAGNVGAAYPVYINQSDGFSTAAGHVKQKDLYNYTFKLYYGIRN